MFVFFQAEDGIRAAHYGLEFRRVLFRSSASPLPLRRSACITKGSRQSTQVHSWIPRPTSPFALPNSARRPCPILPRCGRGACWRSEEHTSELQSLMRISYAVFCLKKKKKSNTTMHSNKLTEPTVQ